MVVGAWRWGRVGWGMAVGAWRWGRVGWGMAVGAWQGVSVPPPPVPRWAPMTRQGQSQRVKWQGQRRHGRPGCPEIICSGELLAAGHEYAPEAPRLGTSGQVQPRVGAGCRPGAEQGAGAPLGAAGCTPPAGGRVPCLLRERERWRE